MKIASHWPGVTKHLIVLALGWCLLSSLLGLFYAFDAMEAGVKPLLAALYFSKVTALALMIGLIALSIPLAIWKILNAKK